jgi:class 3 adenylate cyclase
MARDLPSGTVTFLFTDVAGSTRLLHELGTEAYAGALAEHRRLIRAACAGHGGTEVDTQGDAFFLVFPTAPGALAAAQEIVDGLAPSSLRVRMGVHTGTPFLADEGYVGADGHRAARIAAAGHGGQVLVSASTAALVDGGRLRASASTGSRIWRRPSASSSSGRDRSGRSDRSTGRTCRSPRRRSSAASGSSPTSESSSPARRSGSSR